MRHSSTASPITSLIAIVMIVSALGCGQKEPASESTASDTAKASAPTLPLPSPEEAAAFVQTSAEFSDFMSPWSGWSLPVKESMMGEEQKIAAADLEKDGWIRMYEGSVVLTDKALRDKRWIMRANGFVDIVPLAKKKVQSVTAVTPKDDGTAEIVFVWGWIPNEVGESLRSGKIHDRFTKTASATAKIQPSSEGKWEILSITKIDDPS